MTTLLDRETRELVAALLDSFEGSGLRTVRLPEPERRREPTVRLLNRIMADPVQLDDYVRLVEGMRGQRGSRVVLPLLGRDAPDIPEDAILERGFSAASDDLLADVAICPEGLKALQSVVYADGSHNRLGEWFAAAAVEEPGSEAADPSPGTAEPTHTPVQSAAVRKWLWLVVAGLSGLTCLVGVVGLGTYRTGERVHRSLDEFDADVAEGRFGAAVSHFREAQSATVGTTWPVPGSAKSRLELAARSPHLLDQLLRANDLTEPEAVLREAVGNPLLDRDPSYRYALGLTLRRGGKLPAASAEFEAVLARLGEEPLAEGPGAAPPAPGQSTEPPPQLTRFVVGDVSRAGLEARLTHAMNLLERGESERAVAWLKPAADGPDDRPFGPKFLLWVAGRSQVSDPTLEAIVSGTRPANTPAELRDHAYSCLYRRHYTKAAELFERLFTHPGFANLAAVEGTEFDVSRYHAASAAIRAGRPGDLDTPTEERAKEWHDTALKWATKDKDNWLAKFAKSPQSATATYYWFTTLRYDAWLAVTRDQPLFEQIPPHKQLEWRRLWEELDARFHGLRPLKVGSGGDGVGT